MTTNLKAKLDRIPLELLNEGKYPLIDELFAPDFRNRSVRPGMDPSREGYKQFVTAIRTAFPDLHYTIDDSIEAGDKFVTRLTGSGTMRGDFAGMAPTGKHATWTEIHIVRVVNDLVVEHWGLVQELGMMVQLGIVEAPGRSLVTA